MAIPEIIEQLAHRVRTEIYGRDVREALATSMEATAEVAEWSREVAQQIIDGSFDEGELNTEIERKLNELEQQYAPTLTGLENEIDYARGSEPTLGGRFGGIDSRLSETETTLNQNTSETVQNTVGIIDNTTILANLLFNYEIGTISSDGSDSSFEALNRMRTTNFIKVHDDMVLRNGAFGGLEINVYKYNDDESFISNTGFISEFEYNLNFTGLIRLVVKNKHDTHIDEENLKQANNNILISVPDRITQYLVPFNYEQGTISSFDGKNGENLPNRVRSSKQYIRKGYKIRNMNPDHFQFNVYRYDNAGFLVNATGFISESDFEFTKDTLTRIVVKRIDEGWLTPDDAKNVIEVSADNVKSPANTNRRFIWEVGAISSVNGQNSPNAVNNRARTKLEKVYERDVIIVSDTSQYEYAVHFFDRNMNYLGDTGFISPSEFAIQNDGYIRLVLRRKDNANLQSQLSNINMNTRLSYSVPKRDRLPRYVENDILWGKKLLNFGDSIATGSWAEVIAYKHNMEVHSYATGGATAANVVDKPRIQSQVDQAFTDEVSADYILFNGGTNDAIEGRTTAGTITEGYDDPLDENTFCGGFEKLCKTLKLNWLGAKIIYIRAHNMDSRDDLQIVYGDLAMEICKKWSIPVVDMYNEGGLNTQIFEYKKAYTTPTAEKPNGDGTHPNPEAFRKFYIPRIEAKMKSI